LSAPLPLYLNILFYFYPAECRLEEIIKTYNFANRLPRDQEIRDALNFQPKILDRKTIIERVSQKITDFIDTFIECMGGTV
jgi:type I restriction enzyme R subunit